MGGWTDGPCVETPELGALPPPPVPPRGAAVTAPGAWWHLLLRGCGQSGPEGHECRDLRPRPPGAVGRAAFQLSCVSPLWHGSSPNWSWAPSPLVLGPERGLRSVLSGHEAASVLLRPRVHLEAPMRAGVRGCSPQCQHRSRRGRDGVRDALAAGRSSAFPLRRPGGSSCPAVSHCPTPRGPWASLSGFNRFISFMRKCQQHRELT